MFFLYPIAYPIARLLEWCLGKHEKTFYKRSGINSKNKRSNAEHFCCTLELKELIKLMGESKIDISADEVLIIGGVLELRDKTPKKIMTPLDRVFMISEDSELNEDLIMNVSNDGSLFSLLTVFIFLFILTLAASQGI